MVLRDKNPDPPVSSVEVQVLVESPNKSVPSLDDDMPTLDLYSQVKLANGEKLFISLSSPVTSMDNVSEPPILSPTVFVAPDVNDLLSSFTSQYDTSIVGQS